MAAAIELVGATMRFGQRTLWEDVNLRVQAGEFVAILGPNGAGKSTLLKAVLGQLPLTAGKILVGGQSVSGGSSRLGYIPQQRFINTFAPIRGRDLVGFGLTGTKWGPWWLSRAQRLRIAEVIEQVGASEFADAPIGKLSGGEQQRLRIAQALVTRPQVLLCDEPLLSLDIASQKRIVALIDQVRTSENLAVLFVTHEINPVLPISDRIIYIAGGKAAIGTPAQVLRSEVLSELYQSPVEVLQHRGRVLVFTEDASHHCTGGGPRSLEARG